MNATSKTITRLVYEVKYLDAFNDVIWTAIYKDNIIIKPTQPMPMNWYWYYTELKDAFAALKDAAMAKTLYNLLRMKKIAFQDGIIIKFPNGPWVKPKWKHQ